MHMQMHTDDIHIQATELNRMKDKMKQTEGIFKQNTRNLEERCQKAEKHYKLAKVFC